MKKGVPNWTGDPAGKERKTRHCPCPQVHGQAEPESIHTVGRKWRSQDKNNSRTTVNALAVEYAWTDVRKHSFTVRAVEQWNSLPNSLRVRVLQKETQGRKRKSESYQYN